jgi:hypothetical protein
LLPIPGAAQPQFDWLSWNFGLAEGSNAVVVGNDAIHLVGDESLYEALEAAYRDWRAVGSPSTDDYEITFEPADNAPLRLRRQYYDQVFGLPRV